MAELNYTIINHTARIKLGLSLVDYCIADMIHNLSTNPDNPTPGWCHARKDTLADYVEVGRATAFRSVDKLIEKGLVEKNPVQANLLRTTSLWYQSVMIKRQSQNETGSINMTSEESQNDTNSSLKMSTNKDNIYNDTNKDNIMSDFDIFIDKFNVLFGKKYRDTADRRKKYYSRKKTYTAEEILQALENLSKSDFHKGKNDRGWSADPDFLLRSDSMIDKWINTLQNGHMAAERKKQFENEDLAKYEKFN
jgi:hypothetical protein